MLVNTIRIWLATSKDKTPAIRILAVGTEKERVESGQKGSVFEGLKKSYIFFWTHS
jgi:hypothetical protein